MISKTIRLLPGRSRPDIGIDTSVASYEEVANAIKHQTEEPVDPPVVCADCGRPILDAKRRDGTVWSASDIVEYTKLKFDRPLCASCGKWAAKVEK